MDLMVGGEATLVGGEATLVGGEATLVGREARVLAVVRARPAALHRRTYTGRRGGGGLNSTQDKL